MSDDFDPITSVHHAAYESTGDAAPWSSKWKVLTPHMRAAGGKLGVVQNVLPPGNVGAPFHWHALEDEVFFVLSGRGVLRYGETMRELGPGDCVSCPAGRKVAHQIANPFDEDLVYLAIGNYEPHEVAGYPDTGKIMVRHLKQVGALEPRAYMEGEPDPPRVFELHARSTRG